MSPTVIWFCVGIAFLAGEILTMTFVLLFLGIGAMASAAFSLFSEDTALAFLVFSIASGGSFLLFRGKLLSKLRGRKHAVSDNDLAPQGVPGRPSQIGRTGIVTKAIRPGVEGEISLGGSFWRSVSQEELPEGAGVRVIGHHSDNDILLLVTGSEQP